MPIHEQQATVELRVGREEDDPMLPPRLRQFSEDFETLEQVADDGLGQLYLVRSVKQQEEFCVRFISFSQLPTEESRKIFARCCRRYINVAHQSLAQIYSFHEESDGIWLLMDKVHGTSVEELIDHAEFKSTGKILDVFEKLIACVETLHQVGVRFGGTHPRSIIVQETPTGYALKLRDWWAYALHQAQQGLVDMDTYSYASPEQIQGDGKIDIRADIYTYGVILYEALTSHLPFTANAPLKLALKILNSEPAPFDGPFASTGWSKIALHCLEKDPAKRYESFEELKEDLKPAARGAELPSEKTKFSTTQKKQFRVAFLIMAIFVFMLGISARSLQNYDGIDPEDYVGMALQAEDRGDFLTAQWAWQSAVTADDQDSYALYNLGRMQARNADLAGAIASEKKAIELDPLYTEALCELGQIQYDMGSYNEAIRNFQKAFDTDPNCAEALSSMSLAHSKLGQTMDAITTAERAASIDPSVSTYWTNLAHAYLKAGNLPKAEAEYKHALQVDNYDYKAWAGLGETLKAQGRMDEAKRAMEKVTD